MAKQRARMTDDNPLAPTEQPELPTMPARETTEEAPHDYTRPVSVGLKQSELAALALIAETEGVARNAVMAYFLRWALQEHKEGRLQIPVVTETKRRIEM